MRRDGKPDRAVQQFNLLVKGAGMKETEKIEIMHFDQEGYLFRL